MVTKFISGVLVWGALWLTTIPGCYGAVFCNDEDPSSPYACPDSGGGETPVYTLARGVDVQNCTKSQYDGAGHQYGGRSYAVWSTQGTPKPLDNPTWTRHADINPLVNGEGCDEVMDAPSGTTVSIEFPSSGEWTVRIRMIKINEDDIVIPPSCGSDEANDSDCTAGVQADRTYTYDSAAPMDHIIQDDANHVKFK